MIENIIKSWIKENNYDKYFKDPIYYHIAEIFTDEANGYIYAEDGNTRIEEDMYGSPLGVATLDEVIEKLKEIVKDTDYRRAKVALAFLKGVQKSMPDCVVYHYGY